MDGPALVEDLPRWRRAWARLLEEYIRPVILRLRVRHVSGPRRVAYGADEVLAICVVRNGELHVRSFLEHHFALGVTHVVMLLNDSTDRTAEIAAGYERVSLLRTSCSYARYENVMKRFLARRFSRGRWNLCVDIDELFDYPYSESLPLRTLIGYLNDHGLTAVVAQMLDMFADGPLHALRSDPQDRLRERYPFYDISAVESREYEWSTLTDQRVRLLVGGIRAQVFGTRNGLTKAPLVKVDRTVRLFVDWHHVGGARIADFTCVLLHYPFVESFAAKVADAVATGRYGRFTTDEYRDYQRGVGEDRELVLRRDTAGRLENVAQLLEEGFLVAGPTFAAWRAQRLSPELAGGT